MLSAVKKGLNLSLGNLVRFVQLSAPVARDKLNLNQKSRPSREEGVKGETIVQLDSFIENKQDLYPTAESDDMLFDGMPYKKIPICNIRVTKNNTILTMTDHEGTVKLIRSCGIDGFKNTKKGTNIAAQTSAVNLATNAIEKGFKTIRVRVQGLGPGRLAAVKGLQMGGLSIVSITDNTHVSWNPPRPRKARRL